VDKKPLQNVPKALIINGFSHQALIPWGDRFNPVFPLSIETKGNFQESKW